MPAPACSPRRWPRPPNAGIPPDAVSPSCVIASTTKQSSGAAWSRRWTIGAMASAASPPAERLDCFAMTGSGTVAPSCRDLAGGLGQPCASSGAATPSPLTAVASIAKQSRAATGSRRSSTAPRLRRPRPRRKGGIASLRSQGRGGTAAPRGRVGRGREPKSPPRANKKRAARKRRVGPVRGARPPGRDQLDVRWPRCAVKFWNSTPNAAPRSSPTCAW